MQRIIETEYGDALVEFIRYDEDNKIVNEITGIFLPEYGWSIDEKKFKEHVNDAFHSGAGYNL